MASLLSRIFTSLSVKRDPTGQEQIKNAQVYRLQYCLMQEIASGHLMAARAIIQQVADHVTSGGWNHADATEVFAGGRYTVARKADQTSLSTLLDPTATRMDGFDRKMLMKEMLAAGLSLFHVRKIEAVGPLMGANKAEDTVLHQMARSYPVAERTHVPNGLYCRLRQDEFEPFEVALTHLFKQHGSLNTMHFLKDHKIVTGPSRLSFMPRPTQSVLESLSEKGNDRLQGFLKNQGIMINLATPDFSINPLKGQRKKFWQRSELS